MIVISVSRDGKVIVNNYSVRIRKAMPLPRQPTVGFSLSRSGFELGSVLMGFMSVININIVSSSCKMSDVFVRF
jgi:hypothetical protein